MKRLYTIDTKAINHVLMNDFLYAKPEPARYNLSQILGPGILIVEGDKHKQQVSFSIHLMFKSKKNLKRLLASDYGTVANLPSWNLILEYSLYHPEPCLRPRANSRTYRDFC
jgi:hypothetical protein